MFSPYMEMDAFHDYFLGRVELRKDIVLVAKDMNFISR